MTGHTGVFNLHRLSTMGQITTLFPDFLIVHNVCWREKAVYLSFGSPNKINTQDYIRDFYCPSLSTTAGQHFCTDKLSKYYVGMLVALLSKAKVLSYFSLPVRCGAALLCGRGPACLPDRGPL